MLTEVCQHLQACSDLIHQLAHVSPACLDSFPQRFIEGRQAASDLMTLLTSFFSHSVEGNADHLSLQMQAQHQARAHTTQVDTIVCDACTAARGKCDSVRHHCILCIDIDDCSHHKGMSAAIAIRLCRGCCAGLCMHACHLKLQPLWHHEKYSMKSEQTCLQPYLHAACTKCLPCICLDKHLLF